MVTMDTPLFDRTEKCFLLTSALALHKRHDSPWREMVNECVIVEDRTLKQPLIKLINAFELSVWHDRLVEWMMFITNSGQSTLSVGKCVYRFVIPELDV